ncbi:MAG: hypothetical protein ACI9DF_002558 [Verrucomicrobiales bacterium]|jgi:hypothetical protein
MTDTNSPATDSSHCPKCNAALPKDAPAGLCPACLVAAGIGDSETITVFCRSVSQEQHRVRTAIDRSISTDVSPTGAA